MPKRSKTARTLGFSLIALAIIPALGGLFAIVGADEGSRDVAVANATVAGLVMGPFSS